MITPNACDFSSGVDLATEVSRVARRVYWSLTARTWFIPRYILHRPYDHLLSRVSTWLPGGVRRRLFQHLVLGEYRRIGLTPEGLRSRGVPLPPFDLWRTRFTPCGDLLAQIRSGAIEGKPPVARLDPGEVVFADGSRVTTDAMLCCTGYRLEMPFLSASLLGVEDDRIDLYQHIFPPLLPNLAFVGLVSVAGSHPPVAEMQARWVARVLSGASRLPSPDRMQAAIRRQRSHPLSQNPVPMRVQIPEYTDAIARILGIYPRWWRHPGQILLGPFSANDYRRDADRPPR